MCLGVPSSSGDAAAYSRGDTPRSSQQGIQRVHECYNAFGCSMQRLTDVMNVSWIGALCGCTRSQKSSDWSHRYRRTVELRRGSSVEQGGCAALLWLPNEGVQRAHKRAHGLALVRLVEQRRAGDACSTHQALKTRCRDNHCLSGNLAEQSQLSSRCMGARGWSRLCISDRQECTPS